MLVHSLKSSTRAAYRYGRSLVGRLVPDALMPHRDLLRTVAPYTMVPKPRLKNLYQLARAINRLQAPGDIVECGVCNGGTAAVLAHVALRLPQRRLWLFDSFQGLPAPSQRDGKKAELHQGDCRGDLERVRQILQAVGADMGRVNVIEGWFQDTLSSVRIDRIALLHIDADWYQSVRLCLETFYDHVIPGGFIVVDDYGYWQGCKVAVDEFLQDRPGSGSLVHVDHTGCYFQKLA